MYQPNEAIVDLTEDDPIDLTQTTAMPKGRISRYIYM